MADAVQKPVEETLAATDCVIPSLRFPQKLWRIVNECKSGAISWGSNGQTVLLNYNGFQEEYLNCANSIFKTSNIASFIRQLNLYGFRKVTSHNRDLFNGASAGSGAHDDVHEFLHEHFRYGRLDLLSRVCRKTGVKKALLRSKAPLKLPDSPATPTKDSPAITRTAGMSKLRMCQIALTKALEQAARQYRKEKFWFQLTSQNLPKDALKPKYKEALESNIQIIFQDLPELHNVENIPIIDISTAKEIIDQEKIQWEAVLNLPPEKPFTVSVPY